VSHACRGPIVSTIDPAANQARKRAIETNSMLQLPATPNPCSSEAAL
jgi:hypothetical protein